jgi:hypothetical protein
MQTRGVLLRGNHFSTCGRGVGYEQRSCLRQAGFSRFPGSLRQGSQGRQDDAALAEEASAAEGRSGGATLLQRAGREPPLRIHRWLRARDMRAQEAEVLCFGAGEMLRYTARPVGAVERLAGGVRDAWRAGLGLAAVDYLRACIYLAILFGHKADCTRTRWRSTPVNRKKLRRPKCRR